MTFTGEWTRSWSGSALVTRGGEVVEEISIGHTGEAGSSSCTPRTRFQAGSISKQIMSVVVLALVERGELELDRPIEYWLESLPPRLRPITLRQLLSHNSGIGHWGDIPGLPAILETPPDRSALVAMILDAPLVSAPGTRWRYSGPGFLLVALVIEAATGRLYGELASEFVFSRAGMQDTTSGRIPAEGSEVAMPRRGGRLIRLDAGFTATPGTGDLWTSTADLIRYSHALRHGDLIELDAASLLWTGRIDVDPPDPTDRVAAASAYGCGTFVGRVAGREGWYVPGDNPGYQSLLAYLPREDVSVVVLGTEEPQGIDAILRGLSLESHVMGPSESS